jgi:hypothetical protein
MRNGMKKDKSKDIAALLAQKTRARHREQVDLVISKSRVENAEDVLGIYYGLSEKSKACIVYTAIWSLALEGYSPKEIIALLQRKKQGV